MPRPIPLTAGAHAQPEVDALAYVDLRTAGILAAFTAEVRFHEELEVAAEVGLQLFAVPSLDTPYEETRYASEAIVVSERGVHAYARSMREPQRGAVGIAPSGANVALLLAAARGLAESAPEGDR